MWLAKDPIMFKLGGDFMHYCTLKRAFIRISNVPDDLQEHLDGVLTALEGVQLGTAVLSIILSYACCNCYPSPRTHDVVPR